VVERVYKSKDKEWEKCMSDDQVHSEERKVGRRSFLSTVGAVVLGGAAALALGERLSADTNAYAQESDSDQKKPVKKKTASTRRSRKSAKSKKGSARKKGARKKKSSAEGAPDQQK
jgi:hypothetical protein